MSTVQTEIAALEESLRLAELSPDSEFFERILADDAVIVSEDGKASQPKRKVVEAHKIGNGPKFRSVKMTDMKIVDHSTAAVVTCRGSYEGPGGSIVLNFMRVWQKTGAQWQIIAGAISK